MIVTTGSVVGIYFVTTLEQHRGKGYGQALTWAAVSGGCDRGCSLASLQSSQLGFSVYRRMGFAHVNDYVALHPKG